MSERIKNYLNSVGLNFPENENELIAFNKVHNNYNYTLKHESIDPFKILENIKNESIVRQEATNVDYHKRTVLAAEIVSQLKNDFSLGHLKLQKLIYLCQNAMKMPLHTNFLQQAMGPYDPTLMRSIDSQFKKRKWFEFRKGEFPKYKALEKEGEHKEWYEKYFKNDINNINQIIDTFKSFKTNEVELVATIYACWQKALDKQEEITNELLIEKVYSWHESKKKFSEETITKAIEWMNEKGIHPSM